MKRLLFSSILFLLSFAAFSQIVFDLGLKAGVHSSVVSLKERELLVEKGVGLKSSSFVKAHWGAFGRVGLGRLYVQPEVSFSKKGADLSANIIALSSDFDYSNVDVPLLLGYKVIQNKPVEFRIMAGPVFSFVTGADYPRELEPYLKRDFFDKHIWGLQYGVGVDVLFLTFDARLEHAGNFYDDPKVVTGKATTLMLSVGFKIF